MRTLKGCYREEAGGVMIRHGKLMAEHRGGVYYDAETGGRLTATEFALTGEMRGIDVTSTKDAYHFDPDAGECERIGLAITREV